MGFFGVQVYPCGIQRVYGIFVGAWVRSRETSAFGQRAGAAPHTELMTFSAVIEEFEALNAALAGLPVDDLYSHIGRSGSWSGAVRKAAVLLSPWRAYCPLCTVAGCLWEAPRFACRGADLLRRELALLGFFLSGGSPCSIVC